MRYRIIFLWIVFSAYLAQAQAQTLSQAKVWYSKGQFEKALPVFNKILQTKTKDATIPFWYGVCLLETGKPELALPFLKTAKDRRIVEADRFLAKYYLHQFKPDTALLYINGYLENAKIDDIKRQSAQELKSSIESFAGQLDRVEDICFIDSIIVPKSALYTTLKLSPEAGTILPVNQAFPDISTRAGSAYLPERKDRAFFAKNTPGNGLDIVARHRIFNEWGETEALSDVINTKADECNPYFLADGVTLYFASNGPGSMGGYDLYITRLNRSTNTYLLPDHLNMPFNSTANDYFLILDEFSKKGYLATDRNQKEGFVAIYTFLPNPEKKLIQGKSFNELQQFAQIHSIKATWEGRNMDSLLQQTSTQISTLKETEPDIIFTINDTLNYSKESDFKSEETRKLYVAYRSLVKKYSKGNKILNDKRAQYLQATPELQKTLGEEILKLEVEIRNTQQELPVMEKKIRNLEIAILSKI